MIKALGRLMNAPKPLPLLVGLLLIGVVGWLDYLTGYELSFSLFYLVPIALVAWAAGGRLGYAASALSALVWTFVDIQSGHQYSQPTALAWNAAIRLGFFVIVVYLLTQVRVLLDHERELVRSDYLTGAVSSRYFEVLLQAEIDRSARSKLPFTLAYIDVDNFKSINDRLGHHIGDQLLRLLVNAMTARLRKSDAVARLGGDEFGILLPGAGPAAAVTVVARTQSDMMAQMSKRNWPVTVSIGAVTFVVPPPTADEAIRLADELMYSVKRADKNGIKYLTYER
jgi:diguanylate cyclase (GGDEF)-like protein